MRPNSSAEKMYLDAPSTRCLERHRVLQEVEALGSVAAVANRKGLTRQTIYLWKKRFAASGLAGLEDRPIPPSPGRPKRLTAALQQVLLDQVRAFPDEGCVSLSERMCGAGLKVSSPTLQKTLSGWGLGRRAARKAWVRNGCPAVQEPQPIPVEINLRLPALGLAKAYFFRGIPASRQRAVELPRPNLEQVASLTGVEFGRLQKTASKELWEEARARYWLRIEDSEAQERMQDGHAPASAAIVTIASRLLRVVGKKLQGPDLLRPTDLVKLASTLRGLYKVMTKALGGDLTILHMAPQLPESVAFIENRWISPWPINRGTWLSDAQLKMARISFFTGLPRDGQNQPVSKPSVRQVARHHGVSVRYLQWVATEQGWLGARREVDRWKPENRFVRVINQLGKQNLMKLFFQFHQVNLVLLQRIDQPLWTQDAPSIPDLYRITKALLISQKLAEQIFADGRAMSALAERNNQRTR